MRMPSKTSARKLHGLTRQRACRDRDRADRTVSRRTAKSGSSLISVNSRCDQRIQNYRAAAYPCASATSVDSSLPSCVLSPSARPGTTRGGVVIWAYLAMNVPHNPKHSKILRHPNTLSINTFQNRLKIGRNRHPRARRQPRRRHSPTSRRRPHTTNRRHIITAGHSTITPKAAEVDPTHNHLHTTQNGQQRFSSGSRRSRRRMGRGASWCSRDSPIKPVRWSSSPPEPPAPPPELRRHRTPARPRSSTPAAPERQH